MPYTDRFIPADNLTTHLNSIAASIPQHVQADYSGFLAVSAVTVYELAIKDIFNSFAVQHHPAFGSFVFKHFKRINGRIMLSDLKGLHVGSFGGGYLTSFDTDLSSRQTASVAAQQGSIVDSYDNLILARHKYVHEGIITLTLQEVIGNYNLGKQVIHSLHFAMV